MFREKKEGKPTKERQRLEWIKKCQKFESNEQNQMLSTYSMMLRSLKKRLQKNTTLKVWFCDTVVENLHKSVRKY